MRATDRDALTRAMERILPGHDETLLLRAILHRGDDALRAWAEFRERVPELPSIFRTDTGNRKRLSPLLLDSVRHNDLETDAPLRTVLKTATLREQLRSKIYREIAGEVIDALGDAGLDVAVVKGAALAETAYAEPHLRHAHDIDVLVADDDLHDAARVVRSLGFREAGPVARGQGLDLRHGTDLPVLLLTRLFRIPFYRGRLDDGSLRTRRVPGPGVRSARIPDPVDALLIALGHASYCPNRSNLLWAVDAWMLVHGTPAVDWTLLPGRAREMRVELPVATMLDYLARELGAPIPDGIVEAVRPPASGQGFDGGLRRDVALFGARQAGGAHPDLAGRSRPTLGERLTLLRWELWPSRAYLAWAYHDPPAILLPLLYLYRPVSAAFDRIRWRLIRRVRTLRDGRRPGGAPP